MSRGFKAERIASKLGAQADPRSSLHKEFDKIKGWLPEVFPMVPQVLSYGKRGLDGRPRSGNIHQVLRGIALQS